MTTTLRSPLCSRFLLALNLLLVANTTFGAFRATSALKLGGPAKAGDELVVFFHEVQSCLPCHAQNETRLMGWMHLSSHRMSSGA